MAIVDDKDLCVVHKLARIILIIYFTTHTSLDMRKRIYMWTS